MISINTVKSIKARIQVPNMNSNNQIDTTIMNKVMLLTKEKKYRKIRELVSVEQRLKDIKISANKN